MESAGRKRANAPFLRRYKLDIILRHAVLMAWAVILLFPIYWILFSRSMAVLQFLKVKIILKYANFLLISYGQKYHGSY